MKKKLMQPPPSLIVIFHVYNDYQIYCGYLLREDVHSEHIPFERVPNFTHPRGNCCQLEDLGAKNGGGNGRRTSRKSPGFGPSWAPEIDLLLEMFRGSDDLLFDLLCGDLGGGEQIGPLNLNTNPPFSRA